MLCLKISSGLVRIREPSGAEGLLSLLFNLIENLMKTAATLATENLFTLFIYSVKVHIGLNTYNNPWSVHRCLKRLVEAISMSCRGGILASKDAEDEADTKEDHKED